MKGVPRSTKISKAEFLESLYNSEANSDKKNAFFDFPEKKHVNVSCTDKKTQFECGVFKNESFV